MSDVITYKVGLNKLRDDANASASWRGHSLEWKQQIAGIPFGSTFRQVWVGTCVNCGSEVMTDSSPIRIMASGPGDRDTRVTDQMSGTAIERDCGRVSRKERRRDWMRR